MTAARRGLVLWDVDGTLISVPSGRQDKHHAAALAVLGGPEEAPLSWQGRTDWEILSGLSRAHGIEPSEEDRLRMIKALEDLTEAELKKFPARTETGISAALASAVEQGWENCLLTGNTRARARQKLASAGIEDSFNWRGSYFGDHQTSRMALVAEAGARIRATHPRPSVLVVGDTPLDIHAAYAAGIPVVAVASGRYSPTQLATHRPDLVIDDMAIGHQRFIEFISSLALADQFAGG